MNTVLIIGSLGFIGSNLLHFYVSKGSNVVNIDKTQTKMKD